MSAIDISTYQGTVDFPTVAASGQVELCIAKMGGSNAGVYVDSEWPANRAGIRAAGLRLGSYFFNGPGDTPTQAADFQFQNIDWRPGDVPMIDVEGRGLAYTPAQALEWARRMIWHGVPASSLLAYMSESVENSQDWSALVKLGVQLDVASYGMNTGQPGTPPRLVHWPSWALWQYTSNGTVPGISGRVDVSLIAPSWAGGNVTPLINTPKGDDSMRVIHITSNPVNPTTIPGLAVNNLFEISELGYRQVTVLTEADDIRTTWNPDPTAYIDRTAEEAIVLLQDAQDRHDAFVAAVTASVLAKLPTAAGGSVDLSGLSSAIAAVAADLTALDTASASYHADLAATLAKGFTISGTVK